MEMTRWKIARNHLNNYWSLKVTIELTCTESWVADQLVLDFFNTLYVYIHDTLYLQPQLFKASIIMKSFIFSVDWNYLGRVFTIINL